MESLTTTNVLLAVIATLTVLEAAFAIAVLTGGFILGRRLIHSIERLERQHLAPTIDRMNGVLDDVKSVTSTVKDEVGRADRVARWIGDLFAPSES